MTEQASYPAQPPDYAPLMRDLVDDGWSISSTINPRTPHLTTEQYLDAVDAELKKRMG